MKKKYRIIIIFLLVIICGSVLGSFVFDKKEEKKEEERIALRFAETKADCYPTTKVDYFFSESVKELSDGRVEIKVYDSGKLGDERSVIEQVKFGGIDFARVSADNMLEYLNDYESIPVPLIFEGDLYSTQIMQLQRVLFPKMLEEKLVPLFWIREENRGICSCNGSLEIEEQVCNKKIRVNSSQIMIDLYSQLSAKPITMNEIDVYQGLQTNYIQLVEDDLFSHYYERYYENAPYFIETNYSIPSIVFVGQGTYNEFSYEIKEFINDGAKCAEREQYSIYDQCLEELFEKIAKENIITIELSDAAKQQIKETAMSIYDKEGEDNAETIKSKK